MLPVGQAAAQRPHLMQAELSTRKGLSVIILLLKYRPMTFDSRYGTGPFTVEHTPLWRSFIAWAISTMALPASAIFFRSI